MSGKVKVNFFLGHEDIFLTLALGGERADSYV
jgi:hypothetical protein